jgi:hypothetical protein
MTTNMAEPSESSPLLATDNGATNSREENDIITSFPEITTYTRASFFFKRPIRIMTTSILTTSGMAVMVLLATDIALNYAPFEWHYYATGRSIEVVGTFVSTPASLR